MPKYVHLILALYIGAAHGQAYNIKSPDGQIGFIYGSQHTQVLASVVQVGLIEKAIESSRTVLLETEDSRSILSILSPLPDGKNLRDIVPDQARECLLRTLAVIQSETPQGGGAHNLKFYRPGLLAVVMIAQIVNKEAALNSGAPVVISDNFVRKVARQNGKPIIGLESAADHAEFIDGIPDDDAWNIIARICAVQANKALSQELHQIFSNFRSAAAAGNVDEFSSLHRKIYLSLGVGKAFVSSFWSQRNQLMADKIASSIHFGKRPLAAIGLTHLGGEDGVLNLLKISGFSITNLNEQNSY